MIFYSQFDFNYIKPIKVKYKKEYYDDNIYCFDIETSSAYVKDDGILVKPNEYHKRQKDETPIALCWIWQMSLNGRVVYGRDLQSFAIFIKKLNKYLGIKPIIYIHNASFEFVFLSNVFKWTNIFARSPHRIIYCDCEYAQFRCSYMLTRLSLKNWGKQTGKRQKLDGDLDYDSKFRTPLSVVNKQELGYCENDVLVMHDGLQVYKKRYTHIANIPLTQTGEVRRKVKDMFKDDIKHLFNMTRLLPEDAEMYSIFKSLVWGGITHANVFKVGKIWKNVHSYDITSSYPYVMCARKYPIAPPIKMNVSHWKKYLYDDNYCAFYHIRFKGLKSKLHNHYLSGYKYIAKENFALDNGRIISASGLELWITDIDLQETLLSYDYDEIEVCEMYIAKADYLPKKLIEFILELFENKTKLDGIKGFEDIYLQSKQFINALFGMMLTDIIQDNVIYNNGEWKVDRVNVNAVLVDKKKKWYNNFNSYFQGIWVVAYARQNLWQAVRALDNDVIYYDTDSVKYMGNHDDYFIEYNKRAFSKLENVLLKLGIDTKKAQPVNPKGKVKTLGEFKYEGTYKKFKTLGAKRYVYEDEEGYHMTVAGVNKEHGVKALNTLNDFHDKMIFKHDECKRFQLSYITEQPTVIWNKGKYDEYKSTDKYGVCFTPSQYNMTMTDEFKDLIQICVKGLY